MKKISLVYWFNARNLPSSVKEEHTIKLYAGSIAVIFDDKVFELGPGDSLLVPENSEYRLKSFKKRGKLGITFEQKIEPEVTEKLEEILQIIEIEEQTGYEVVL